MYTRHVDETTNTPGPGEIWLVKIIGQREVVLTDSLDPVFYRWGITEPFSVDADGVEWIAEMPTPCENCNLRGIEHAYAEGVDVECTWCNGTGFYYSDQEQPYKF